MCADVRAIVRFKGDSDWLTEVEVLVAAQEEEMACLCLTDLLALVGHRLYAI